MAEDRCERCQNKHGLGECKIQRGKIKKKNFWSGCMGVDEKEAKEKEFMALYPGNVQSTEHQTSSIPEMIPPEHDSKQLSLRPNPTPPASASPGVPLHAAQPLVQKGKAPASIAAAPVKPHGAVAARGAVARTNLPNQTGFPHPTIRLPKVQRQVPAYNQSIFVEKTQPIERVTADINLTKDPPSAYRDANSLRTQYGTGGASIRIITNHVAVKKAPSLLYEYTVDLDTSEKMEDGTKSPRKREIKRRSELRQIFDVLNNVAPLQSRTDWATDFTNIWSVKPLFDGDIGTVFPISNVTYRKPNGRQGDIPQVVFTFKRTLDFARGHLDLIEVGDADADVAMKSRALNAIVSKNMSLSTATPITLVGGNRFFLEDAYSLLGPECPFVTLRGYFSSIRPGMDRMLLNVNTATSAFFKPMLVSEFCQALDRCRVRSWTIKSMLKNVGVRITYNRPQRNENVDPNAEENRRKVIAGFGQPPSVQTFVCDGESIRVSDFFKAARLRDASTLPCINVGQDQPNREQWIPAELLEIEFPQLFTSVLPSIFTDKMMSVALRKPAENANLIVNEGLVHLGIKEDPRQPGNASSKSLLLKNIGFDVEDKLIDIPARILLAPKLQYGQKVQPVAPRFASWNLVDNARRLLPFAQSCQLPGIGILDLRASPRPPQALVHDLRAALSGHGIRVGNANWVMSGRVGPDHEGSYVESMKREITEHETEMRKAGISLVVFDGKDFDIYAAVKTVCDTRGLKTICLASSGKATGQLLSNLALKYSLKTGGRPHQIAGDLREALGKTGKDFNNGATMIMGADVTHPGKGSKPGCPSVAAVVGSFDGHFINYGGSMRLQRARQEVIGDMCAMATELLGMYSKKQGKLPANIVFYRDGVSEGQYEEIRRTEMAAIERAWAGLRTAQNAVVPKVKMACLVVGKRHNTRFYPKDGNDADRGHNLKPGLVVDSVITHPYCFDFFLQSHAAVKGTARSAHYFLLRNDMGLTAQQLQDLTHSLCYAYGTATKGISYCAPAYLADKLCDRGRAYIRDWLLARPQLSAAIRTFNPRASPDVTARQHDERVAAELGRNRPFNIWATALNGQFRGRMNPWHPDLDDKMFWV